MVLKKRQIFFLVFIVFVLGFLVYFYQQYKNQEDLEFITLIAVGDTGTGEEMQYRVANSITKACSRTSCVGVLHLGDIMQDLDGISSIYDTDLSSKFEKPYQNLEVPFYMALGNHDYLGCVDCYIAYSTMSAKWRLPSRYYKKSFNDNLLDVFIADTNNLDEAQMTWLIESIKKSEAKWKFVVGHHPLFSHGYHGNAQGELKDGLEKILCNNVDLYLSGHDHHLEYFGKVCDVNFVIAGGGGGIIRQTESRVDDASFFKDTHGFLKLDISYTELVISFLNEENQLLYKIFLN